MTRALSEQEIIRRESLQKLRDLGIEKPRGYPCNGKTKSGYPCGNPSKYEGRKCHVHKTIHDPSLFFDTEDEDYYYE